VARRRRQGLEVSLFPFLSVLACVIGTLTLILASMAVSHVGSSSLEGIRLGERFDRLQAALVQTRLERDALDSQLTTAQADDADRDRFEQRLTGLGLSPEISLEELEKLVDERRAASEIVTLSARAARLEAEKRTLDEEVAGLQADVDVRADASENLTMRIAPSGTGPVYRPYFAECTADYLELHTAKSDFKYRVPKEDLLRGLDFDRFLRRIRLLRNARLVFLIRPDGVETYKMANEAASRIDVPTAKLPLPGDGQLDFSLFDDQEDQETGGRG